MFFPRTGCVVCFDYSSGSIDMYWIFKCITVLFDSDISPVIGRLLSIRGMSKDASWMIFLFNQLNFFVYIY